ncbi:MAG: hypothetical protein A2X56_06740 [Nitrospirae bacterium GWC2_57_13]|jgi:hypothetical protein|nr:MAG: hypothetical protein A2072_07380 [Nitrospirae bacterium GWC1_57_7]OGW29994.1 MAG: hypothetical protein A2X56_06740 [Nitrospirae bacterium GWC2_57_13]HAR46431.1 hypothetical protein [Nitrospiraceae bacterium]HAS53349.1 hypothetical protein [Nitrospiraceae bacterium]
MGKPNFSFQKRQKEIAKKKKLEEKKQRKLEKKADSPADGLDQPTEGGELNVDEAPEETQESGS